MFNYYNWQVESKSRHFSWSTIQWTWNTSNGVSNHQYCWFWRCNDRVWVEAGERGSTALSLVVESALYSASDLCTHRSSCFISMLLFLLLLWLEPHSLSGRGSPWYAKEERERNKERGQTLKILIWFWRHQTSNVLCAAELMICENKGCVCMNVCLLVACVREWVCVYVKPLHPKANLGSV